MNDLERFVESTATAAPAAVLAPALEALWWLRRGDWTRAHEIVQAQETESAAWVHAHLHRVEGDLGNARYWYGRAGRAPASDALDREWERIATALLQER
jgi:hypothetical protein